jgi:hypothetical protein
MKVYKTMSRVRGELVASFTPLEVDMLVTGLIASAGEEFGYELADAGETLFGATWRERIEAQFVGYDGKPNETIELACECPECGYEWTTANLEEPCPECGRDPSECSVPVKCPECEYEREKLTASVQLQEWIGDTAFPVGDQFRINVTDQVRAMTDKEKEALFVDAYARDRLWHDNTANIGQHDGPFEVYLDFTDC